MNKIKRYSINDEDELLALIQREEDDWREYWSEKGQVKYIKALANSIVYLIYEDNHLCGYLRCRDDDGFGVYIYDLLIDANFRGKGYGKQLMERVASDFLGSIVYVMSDVDDYYKKLNYEKVGSIFAVSKS